MTPIKVVQLQLWIWYAKKKKKKNPFTEYYLQ